MRYAEFQRHIGKAGLKLHEFASLMGMNSVSLSNYRKKGNVPQHLAMIAALIGEMAERGIDYRAILLRFAATPKKPRGIGIGKFGGGKQKDVDAKVS